MVQHQEQILMEQLKRARLQEQKTIMENEDLRKQTSFLSMLHLSPIQQ
ncbi:hypothetical protein V6Z12_A11G369600 [Gossypium hirsutum]